MPILMDSDERPIEVDDGAATEIFRLRAEVERLRETNEAIKRITKQWRIDAERYRWLRNFQNLAITREVLGEYDTLDAAIDAAMRGGK